MTALTLALVAGLAVGSDGRERISEETEQHFLGSGYWEGTLKVLDFLGLETGSIKLGPGTHYWKGAAVIADSANNDLGGPQYWHSVHQFSPGSFCPLNEHGPSP